MKEHLINHLLMLLNVITKILTLGKVLLFELIREKNVILNVTNLLLEEVYPLSKVKDRQILGSFPVVFISLTVY